MTSNVSAGQLSREVLITSTLRVLTWNVWGRFGPWKAREAALINTLKLVQPDIVALQECWRAPDGETQASRLGQALGYHHAYGGGTFLVEDWGTGAGLLSRWPIQSHEYREFPAIAADRWGGSGRWCTIRVMDIERQPEALSGDALRHWHAEAGHPVQHRAADLCLGLLGR